MRERVLSLIHTKEKPLSSLPNEKIKKQPKKINISVSNHEFLGFEDMSSEQIPGATIHSYHEKGTNLNVKIIEFGLNDPKLKDDPFLLRIDHGCSCMDVPLDKHDCAMQRDIAFQTIQTIGKGMIVLVNNEASAAMGHGEFDVMQNMYEAQKAKYSGKKEPPTIVEYFQSVGITNYDIRKHPEIAALIAHRLEETSHDAEQSPIIFLGSSPAKIDSLKEQGIAIADTARVIVPGKRDPGKAEQLGYGKDSDVTESGVYLELRSPNGKNTFVLLTEIYHRYKDLILTPRQRKKKGGVVYDMNDLPLAA